MTAPRRSRRGERPGCRRRSSLPASASRAGTGKLPAGPALASRYSDHLNRTLDVLATTPADSPVRTFPSRGERRAGGRQRRLAVELAIHRWDAQYTAGLGGAVPGPAAGRGSRRSRHRGVPDRPDGPARGLRPDRHPALCTPLTDRASGGWPRRAPRPPRSRGTPGRTPLSGHRIRPAALAHRRPVPGIEAASRQDAVAR
jgi:Mycothiol maleylpyruvate isomerase N-terminal domain